MQGQQVFEPRAPRTRLEQLSRCGSDLRGEAAVEVCGNLAISNPAVTDRLWADAALLAATRFPVSSDTIYALTCSLLPDVVARMKPLITRRLKGRFFVARNILFTEFSLLALGRRHRDTIKDRAKEARMRDAVFAIVERDVISIVHDRIEFAASNARKDPW